MVQTSYRCLTLLMSNFSSVPCPARLGLGTLAGATGSEERTNTWKGELESGRPHALAGVAAARQQPECGYFSCIPQSWSL